MRKAAYWLIVLIASSYGLAACGNQLAPVQSEEGYVTSTDSVKLYYRTLGAGPDTIVVLHGGAMGLPLDYLAPDLEPLAESHVLIFYDQRGAGRSTLVSDSTHVHVAAHVADVEHIREYFGIERMTILGHSWGAGLAARYAHKHPGYVARLILVGPMPIRYTPHWAQFAQNLTVWMDSTMRAELERVGQAIGEIETAPDPKAVCREFWNVYKRGYFADPHDTVTIQRIRGDMCQAPADALRNSEVVRRLTMRSLGDFDWRSDFRDIRVPVLVIHGASEPMPMASTREWKAAFPDARLVVIDSAAHYPHVERPERFFSVVREFVH